jgi:hypothetical protein
MTAQIVLSILMAGVLLYAGNERRRSPVVAWLSIAAAMAGLYFTWVPEHATFLAQWTGIGRGADVVLCVGEGKTIVLRVEPAPEAAHPDGARHRAGAHHRARAARAQPARRPERRRMARRASAD